MSDDLRVRLVIEALDRASAPLRHISSAMSGIARVAPSLQLATNRVAGLTASVANYSMVAGGSALTATGAYLTSVISTGREFERLAVQLKSLEGSAEGADRAMEWIVKFAKETPLELQDVVKAYSQLRTYGLDPTNGTLQSLTDVMAKSGKGAEQLEGIIMAVGQAWTKQKLQGEEAMQLLERGVPVWDLLGKATGQTVVQLQELASKGKLGRDAIRMLVTEMGKSAGSASADFARTMDGIWSNIADSVTRFQLKVSDAGPYNAVKAASSDLLQTLDGNSQATDRLAKTIGAELTKGVNLATDAIRGMVAEQGGVERFAADVGMMIGAAGGAFAGFTNTVNAAARAVRSLQDVGIAADKMGTGDFWAVKGPQFVAPERGATRWVMDRLNLPDSQFITRETSTIPAAAAAATAPSAPLAVLTPPPAPSVAAAAGRAAATASQGANTKAEIGGSLDITIRSPVPVEVDRTTSRNPAVLLKVKRLGTAMPDSQ